MLKPITRQISAPRKKAWYPTYQAIRRTVTAAVMVSVLLLPAGNYPAGAASSVAHGTLFSDWEHNPCGISTLAGWKSASEAERQSYLRGLLDMLELERYWQGNRPLSLKRSLAASWTDALDGVTVAQMCGNLELYLATYPEHGQRAVLFALWEIYVLPRSIRK